MVSEHVNPVSRADVESALCAILADRRFASAQRNARFLSYVVARTLEGKADEIKETVIAAEVYGRNLGQYDPKSDSIVRVEASRLRQKLRSYYDSEGSGARVRIDLPSGGYVPHFHAVSAPPPPRGEATLDRESDAVVSAGAPPSRNTRAWAAAAVLVVALVSIQVAGAPRSGAPPNAEAFAAWQEGVALLAQDPHTANAQHGAPASLIRAAERLEYAVAKDPNFAQAWATLAEAYDYLFPYVGRNPVDDATRAEAAARRAVELDNNLASAHHMLGLIQWMMRWDFASAEASYKRALALDPRNIYAVVEYADLLRERGRSDEAALLIRKSQSLLPALPQLAAKEAEIHLDFGATAKAIEASMRALHLKRNFLRAHVALAAAEEMKGDLETARSRYEHVLTVNPTDRRALPAYGYLLARMGHRELAIQVARRLEDINANVRNCAFQIAVVYAGLGEEERALDWLDRALRTHQTHFPFAAVEHRFRSLHGHPRFRTLLKEAGLTQAAH